MIKKGLNEPMSISYGFTNLGEIPHTFDGLQP